MFYYNSKDNFSNIFFAMLFLYKKVQQKWRLRSAEQIPDYAEILTAAHISFHLPEVIQFSQDKNIVALVYFEEYDVC